MRFALFIRCSLVFVPSNLGVYGFASFYQPPGLRTDARGRNNRVSMQKEDADPEEEAARSIALANTILRSLRRRTPAASLSSPAPLNLETDFYDPSTGLHSEGVWHNCLAGMAAVKLAELQQDEGGQENLTAALRMAESLWGHWDGVSFQRRSWSGHWDHGTLQEGDEHPPEQPNYYRASSEHRCIQHGIALLFWSKLVHHPSLQNDSEVCYRCKAQYKLITKQFLHEYWDDAAENWRTVSKSQGGGTTARTSASAGTPATGSDAGVAVPYYRAVDQAVGLLACLEMTTDDAASVADVARSTCRTLLVDFGYRNGKESVTYLGLERNRNLWHDGWVALALAACARSRPECWPTASDAHGQVGSLIDDLWTVYGDEDSGTMWHWAKAKKAGCEDGNVRYCGDNALWYALCRAARRGSHDAYRPFWNFVHELQANDEDGLVSVADVYGQVRLHPNTELACLVLWPIDVK